MDCLVSIDGMPGIQCPVLISCFEIYTYKFAPEWNEIKGNSIHE